MLGQSLGSYTIERELGRGGMGAVYTAVHGLLGRRAAVKVLLPELSRNQDVVQRFFNEARAATAIKHPSIVEIYDFGWAPDGSAYIVMELMEGESLSARLHRLGRLPVAAAVTIARQIANALAAAHKAGIVHRDLKPDNVFLVPDIEVVGGERVKLLDFGIAKLAADGAVSRTSTGAIMGTPLYMSPEQCEGARQVDHRTDLYALGCILFEMIAGRVPFVSEGVGGLIGMHLHVPPPALRSLAPDAPADVEAIVARLLAKQPDARFVSADELAQALGRAGTGAPVSLPPVAAASVPPATVPTTLSGAAGAAATAPPAPAPRRGRWLVVGGLGAAVAVAVVTVLATSGGGGDSSVAAADAAVIAQVVSDAAAAEAIAADAGGAEAIAVDASVVDAAAPVDAGVPVDARPRHRPRDAGVPVDARPIEPVPLPIPAPGPGLSRDHVVRVMSRARARFADCFHRAGVDGTVKLKLVIDPSGSVSEAAPSGGPTEAHECITRVGQALKFPASDHGLTFTYPVHVPRARPSTPDPYPPAGY